MGAKCQYVAFKLAVGPSVNNESVANAVLMLNDTAHKIGGRERFIRVGRSGDYLVGRWAGFRGKNRTVVADTKTREMIWNQLPDGIEHTAPNYFVLHTRTLHGIYQKYAASNSLNHFGEWLRRVATEAVRDDRKSAADAARDARKKSRKGSPAGPRRTGTEDRQEIGNAYAVDFGPLIHPQRLEAVLAKWQAISALRYKVFVPRASETEYGPLAPHTHISVHEFRMSTTHEDMTRKAGVSGAGFGQKVADTVAWLKARYHDTLKRTSLSGKDERGQPRTVNLNHYTDSLGEDSLDDVLTDNELATADVVSSILIARMLDLCGDRPEYFT